MQAQALIEEIDDGGCKVVINHEEQYSLCSAYALSPPVDRGNPAGWRDAGFAGSRDACLAYIDENWTDMRPVSLRKALAAASAPAPAVIRKHKSDPH